MERLARRRLALSLFYNGEYSDPPRTSARILSFHIGNTSHRETHFLGEVTMENNQELGTVVIPESETLSIDGFTISLHFSKAPDPGIMSDIKDILFNAGSGLTNIVKICKFDNSMR